MDNEALKLIMKAYENVFEGKTTQKSGEEGVECREHEKIRKVEINISDAVQGIKDHDDRNSETVQEKEKEDSAIPLVEEPKRSMENERNIEESKN